MAKNRCGTYARQSTPQQQSVDTQLGLCRKLIDQRGWRESFRLSDRAFKGGDNKRPGYQRILQLADQRRIDTVVVWKLDRLFRSLSEASTAREYLQDCEVDIVSVTEPFDSTTSTGKLLFAQLSAFSAFETDLLRERTLLGYERRVHAGKWTGVHPPFGYRKNAEGKLKICPPEAEVLATMRRQYKRLGGDNQVAHWLNEKGLTKRGSPWTAPKVRNALVNPISIGKLTQRGATSVHERLRLITNRQYRTLMEHRDGFNHMGTHQSGDARQRSINRVFEAYFSQD